MMMRIVRAAACVLLALGLALPISSFAVPPAIDVRIAPTAPRQGDLAIVSVGGVSGARNLTGRLGDRVLSFFPHADGHAAVVGIDLETPAGRLPWRLDLVDSTGASRHTAGALTIRAR